MINSIMSKKLVTVTPDNTISDAMNLMDSNHYKELPVIDKKNKVLGLITYSNILSIVKFNGNSKIDSFIEGTPIVHENDSKQYALDLMINSGLMGLPVFVFNLTGFSNPVLPKAETFICQFPELISHHATTGFPPWAQAATGASYCPSDAVTGSISSQSPPLK